ncbi:ABC transporter substrate-binding protein [Bosea psychrotolerans]|uniref:Peptide/nickel transport system substrate-binding protein n=1 Tax=Bosea psychrotolerans TaxID=1871628 RepID=A0A2S4LZ59_9HYPH|nr:ABC transporter substrate-binding protein [Bosea psychrotolerans]POR47746.1 peptide/nickel transport system substrate-binding protein [Bosea psychrotolerans]
MTQLPITRRSALAGLAAATALPDLSFAQGAPKTGGTPKSGGTLKISHPTRVASLNVLQISGPAEYLAVDMLYSGLTRMGPDMRAQPDLALEWSADADAKSFVFKLKPNVTFHDGKPFTAEDVVATIKTIQDPKSASPARTVLSMIGDVAAVDPLTVKFTLTSSYADLPISLAHANARIVSAETLKGPLTALDTKANGTGPFKQESFDSARMLKLVKNPAYHQPGKPYLDAVEMHLFPDLAAETQNYLSGAVDAMLEVQQADFKRISTAPGSVGVRTPSGRFVNVVMRQDQKPFDDVRVRRAMAMAIDRPTLVDIILEGYGRPAGDNVISPGYRYLLETTAPKYDPAAAKKLLAEAGYPNGLKIPLICSNRPAIRSQVGIAIKEMAKPAGFDIDVQTMPHDTYLANVWMKGQFYIGYWGMQSTEDQAFTLLFTTDAAFADTAWNSKEFDALVAKGRATIDDAERRKIYAEAQALMVRDVPSVIPFFQDVLTANRSYVKNWGGHPLARYFFVENVWLDKA